MSVQTIPPAPGRGGRWVRIVVRSLAAAAIAAATAWGAGLIGFQFPGAPPWRVVLIAVWCALGAASVVTLVLRRAAMRKPTLTAFAAGLAALLA